MKGVTAQNGNTFVWLWSWCPTIAVIFRAWFCVASLYCNRVSEAKIPFDFSGNRIRSL